MPAFVNDSKVFGSLFSREPSATAIKLYRLVWIGFYILLFVFRDKLPEKFSRDAGQLAEMIQDSNFSEGSYGAMAAIYSMVPGPLLPFVPLPVCVISLWLILRHVRSYIVMAVLAVVLPPYLIMNFMNPTKETMVGLIAILVFYVARSRASPLKAFCIIAAVYGVYALFIREYYFLILAFFSAIFFLRHAPPSLAFAMAFLGICVMALLPPEIFQKIQGARDQSALELGNFGYEVRTVFFNLVPPDSFLNFLINTGWGLLAMFMPLVIAQSFNEILMMVNVYFYAGMVLAILRHKTGAAKLPAFLFMAHILTQAQFEPDLGSYVRHFSSVLLFIAPGMEYLFRSPRRDAQAGDQPDEASASTISPTLR